MRVLIIVDLSFNGSCETIISASVSKGYIPIIWIKENTLNKYLIILALIWWAAGMSAQEKVTISGYVTDARTGESLIGANIYVKSDSEWGTFSNAYGFYSLTLAPGDYTLVATYLGYQNEEHEVSVSEGQKLNFDLDAGVQIAEVVVTDKQADKNVQSTEMGTMDLSTEQIKRLPALFGEVDVLKTIQLLPGVSSVGEGNAGFYVRGGGPDQNLVLLDEAVVYNTGHMLGFFSVFNADAIKNTTVIKGGAPAQYGGRISSVLDIQMNEGNSKHYSVQGGIGLISSRLTAEGPIVKDKSSFIISGRRTYALDLAQPFLNNTNFAGTNYYFYDLNAKVNYKFSDRDRVYASAYFGRDVLVFNSNERDFGIRLPYGNATATVRWNHLFNDKHFSNVSLIYNEYDFTFSGDQEEFRFEAFSGVNDYTAKMDFEYYPNPSHVIRYGVSAIYHKMTPNIVSATNGENDFKTEFEPKYGLESGIYIQDDYQVNDRLTIKLGLRYSRFSQLGPYTSKLTGETFDRWESAVDYDGWEPRVAVKFSLTPTSSLKANYSRAYQYVHLVSNSSSTLPADVWVPSTEIVRPQESTQYAIGFFKNFFDNGYETSVELYYKDLENQIDYRDSYVNNVSTEVEDDFVFGSGRAYGAEFFLKRSRGDLTGWIGYTLSRTERTFDDIEDGRTYPAVYDRTHDVSVVASYRVNDKWDLSGVFVYGTGRAFTPIESLYFIENKLNVQYGPRNSARFKPYHRIDVSATYTPKPNSNKAFTSSWTFSIYNVYNRRNTFFTYTTFESDALSGAATANAYRVSLFPVIPSVTWNFKWNQDHDKQN